MVMVIPDMEMCAPAAPPPLTPPHKGEGESELETLGRNGSRKDAALTIPSPLWGSEGRARQVARPVSGEGDIATKPERHP
jgi:hypothetical protein